MAYRPLHLFSENPCVKTSMVRQRDAASSFVGSRFRRLNLTKRLRHANPRIYNGWVMVYRDLGLQQSLNLPESLFYVPTMTFGSIADTVDFHEIWISAWRSFYLCFASP